MQEKNIRKLAKTFQDLVVWQKSHHFVPKFYRLTKGFPKTEIYGLSAQFQRPSASISAIIAKGFKKGGMADKARFMNIAQGSLEES